MGMLSNTGAKKAADHASRQMRPWILKFARIGFMAKGAVYILVGALSFLAAIGGGGQAKGTNGAMSSVAAKPYGEVLLWLLAIGLVGYIFWLAVQVFKKDPLEENKYKEMMQRAGNAISCGIYIALTIKAVSLAVHAGSSGNAKEAWTAKLLATEIGPWIVGLVGAGIIIYGIKEIVSAVRERFLSQFKTGEMDEKEILAVKKAGKAGIISRGLVIIVLGFFVIKMAVTVDPNNPKGMDGALQKILAQEYGPWMLAVLSIGLALYGVYEILKGKNKHITI
ncbi:DUF1206 domain-containing protein [Peribacillus sp. SCS-26]|uniref:DUF1206 domain-containing protein n=1 Tax=Paraperibacillus marinus TaxID=3115295 RepID=UPI003906A354